MPVQAVKVNLSRDSAKQLDKLMAEGYAAGTSTIAEVAKHGRFKVIMPQLQAALYSGSLKAAARVTRDTLAASRITHYTAVNNRAYQFFEDIILPTAERSPKLAKYLLLTTKRTANRHSAHSLFVRAKVLEKFGYTNAHLDEATGYRSELFEYERCTKDDGKKYEQKPMDKIPLALKEALFAEGSRDAEIYDRNISNAIVAIWKRINPDMPIKQY